MTDSTERDFEKSFRWRVKLRTDRPHSWKSHAFKGTLAYEVLGILEFWASKDPHRFLNASMAQVLKRCNKGPRADKEYYSMDMLKKGPYRASGAPHHLAVLQYLGDRE